MIETPYNICEFCRERVEPTDNDVVRAVELVNVGTMTNPHDLAEGMGVYFHRGCWPGDGAGYRLKPLD